MPAHNTTAELLPRLDNQELVYEFKRDGRGVNVYFNDPELRVSVLDEMNADGLEVAIEKDGNLLRFSHGSLVCRLLTVDQAMQLVTLARDGDLTEPLPPPEGSAS